MSYILKLPTKAPRKYRGKHPYRMHHYSAGGREQWLIEKHFPDDDLRGSVHLELNNGDRFLVNGQYLEAFNKASRGGIFQISYVKLAEMALDMSQEEYDKWLADIRAARHLWDSDHIKELQHRKTHTCGHTARAAIEAEMIAFVKQGVEEQNGR